MRPIEEVEMGPINDEDKLLRLYEAASSGSVLTLTELIRDDPHILHRISLSSKPETPLHLSALSGHLDFTKALLTRKPQLASVPDSFKCSPLHLASAVGHTEIVKALLGANKEVCMDADEEGRIPLHLAAMRGKVDIIKELVHAMPESIHRKLNGSSVVHICVQYNQLKALKLLVTLTTENQLLQFRDKGDNTVLHLAVMLRQTETIRYLVSIPEIKANISNLNRMGLSALDLLECYPRDFKSIEIGDILIKSGCRRSTDEDVSNPSNSVPTQPQLMAVNDSRSWLKGKMISAYRKHNKHEFDWVEKMQETLMLVATLTAGISFQVAVNPPGGVWQQDYGNLTVGDYYCSNYTGGCLGGTAVLSYAHPDEYEIFIIYAIVSLMASLGVVFLAISGLPLKNKLGTWLMIIAMISAIIFLLLAYLMAIAMVTADHILLSAGKVLNITRGIWIGLVATVVVFGMIRLLFWLVRFLSKLNKQLSSRPTRNQKGPIC